MRRRGASKRKAESAKPGSRKRTAESAKPGSVEACYGFEQKGNAQHEQSDLFLFSAVRCALRPLYLVICPLSACCSAEQLAARSMTQHMPVIAHQLPHDQWP